MGQREIPWCLPDLSGNEHRYLTEAAAAGQIGPAGGFLTRFEHQLAERAGVRHAVATSSGTAALHIAVVAAGVRSDQEVVTAAWTFVATGNAIRHAGAHPVVLDVDADHWQLEAAQLDRFLTHQCTRRDGRLIDAATGRAVTAIVPVHLLGHPADLDAIRALADEHGLAVIEDAAQAFGATYRGRPAGSGGLAAVSFNTNKLITAGSGGAILTDDPQLAERARYLIKQAREHPGEYRHGEVGFNYRMTNLHAAIGCAQLERIEAFITAKRRIFDRYADALGDIDGLNFQTEAAWAQTTRWFTALAIDPHRVGTSAARLRAALEARGIHTGPSWTPLHLTGAHRGAAPWPCPTAERLGRNVVQLPCSAGLTEGDQDRVIAAVRAATPAKTAH